MKRSIAPGLAVLLTACAAVTPSRNLVVSQSSPQLTLEIDRSFKPLPPLRFPIEHATDAERRIFVEPGAAKTVRRMVIVQFEKVQPGSDFRFRYPSKPPRRFGAATYRFGTFAYDDERAARAEPSKEAGRTRPFLSAAGLVPPRLYEVARLARVTDPQGLSEVIIFYMENADAHPPPGPPDADGDYELPPGEAAALTARMEQAVRVVSG